MERSQVYSVLQVTNVSVTSEMGQELHFHITSYDIIT